MIGAQWGDEGKGKIVDLLTERVAGVVRFQGGHNAGHTLVINGKKTVLRLIPVGHPARERDLLHRQRRGAVAESAVRGDGGAASAPASKCRAACASRRRAR